MNITDEEKKILLECARQSIISGFEEKTQYEPDYEKHPVFEIPAGAFVTLRKHGQLRGCVGFIEPESGLFDTISLAAKYSAFHDSRFQPVEETEVKDLSIEISVLSRPEKMNSYDEIEIGRHGLILQDSGRRALLLPQVPVEHHLNREEFLSALCEKAGLYREYWRRKQLKIFLFTAIIFSEDE